MKKKKCGLVEISTLHPRIQNDIYEWYKDNRNSTPPKWLTPEEVWNKYLEWNGLIGWGENLDRVHREIFK